jgi:deazaflavin-dependent oxidoreductase (nitroreductase family)
VSVSADDEPLDSARPAVAEHARRYVASGGRDGGEWEGAPCLVLTTRGRRTGRLRRTPLVYAEDGDDYVVVATGDGGDAHPSWYANLVASPVVTVQVGSDVFTAQAVTVTPEEKRRLWPALTAVWPEHHAAQAATTRDLPVVLLRPT